MDGATIVVILAIASAIILTINDTYETIESFKKPLELGPQDEGYSFTVQEIADGKMSVFFHKKDGNRGGNPRWYALPSGFDPRKVDTYLVGKWAGKTCIVKIERKHLSGVDEFNRPMFSEKKITSGDYESSFKIRTA